MCQWLLWLLGTRNVTREMFGHHRTEPECEMPAYRYTGRVQMYLQNDTYKVL